MYKRQYSRDSSGSVLERMNISKSAAMPDIAPSNAACLSCCGLALSCAAVPPSTACDNGSID